MCVDVQKLKQHQNKLIFLKRITLKELRTINVNLLYSEKIHLNIRDFKEQNWLKNLKKESGKSISDRLGINEKASRTALNDLTNNDGSEDPGAELDTEFSNITNKDNKKIPKLIREQYD